MAGTRCWGSLGLLSGTSAAKTTTPPIASNNAMRLGFRHQSVSSRNAGMAAVTQPWMAETHPV